jgi:ribosomal protein S18 acetylase RimI-like enzyme
MPDPELTIRDFVPDDQPAFRRLNEEWIVRHFAMESKDEEVLSDPQSTILNRGGRILMAMTNGEPVGCCALLAMQAGEYEVAKMAVSPSSRRTGVGRKLLTAAVETARASGASRLYLETNQKLTAAIRLYESIGFCHLPPERVIPSPYLRANVYMELDLGKEGAD